MPLFPRFALRVVTPFKTTPLSGKRVAWREINKDTPIYWSLTPKPQK